MMVQKHKAVQVAPDLSVTIRPLGVHQMADAIMARDREVLRLLVERGWLPEQAEAAIEAHGKATAALPTSFDRFRLCDPLTLAIHGVSDWNAVGARIRALSGSQLEALAREIYSLSRRS